MRGGNGGNDGFGAGIFPDAGPFSDGGAASGDGVGGGGGGNGDGSGVATARIGVDIAGVGGGGGTDDGVSADDGVSYGGGAADGISSIGEATGKSDTTEDANLFRSTSDKNRLREGARPTGTWNEDEALERGCSSFSPVEGDSCSCRGGGATHSKLLPGDSPDNVKQTEKFVNIIKFAGTTQPTHEKSSKEQVNAKRKHNSLPSGM